MDDSPAILTEERVAWLGWHALPRLQVECEEFQGSLGTLVAVVRAGEVDLRLIPLAPICTSYLTYLLESGEIDVEQAAVALTALAYLIERKAGRILPRIEDEKEEDDDPIPTSFETSIDEYQPALDVLVENRETRELMFFRGADPAEYEAEFEPVGVPAELLAKALQRVLDRAKPDLPPPANRHKRSMAEQIEIVWEALTREAKPLDELIVGEFTKSEVVWWFLALLELIRLGQAFVQVSEDEQAVFGRREAYVS